MSLDFSYPELDPAAVYRDEQQLHLNAFDPGAGAAGPHDRFPMQEQLSYASYSGAQPAASSSYAAAPRYGQPIASTQATIHQPHAAHGQQYHFDGSYMYTHHPSMYQDAAADQQQGLSFDMLGQQHHAPPQSQQQQQQQHPYHRQNGSAYPYASAPPTVPSNAPLAQQSAYSDVLDRHRTMQTQAYQADHYGLALSSAVGGNMGPSPLTQYVDRGVPYQSAPPDARYGQAPPVAQAQQPLSPVAPDDALFDQLRFASPTGPSPPHQQPGDHAGPHAAVASPTGTMSVNDELAKLNIHPNPGPCPSSADLVSFMRPYLEQYVNTSNRLAFGERTLIVMSSKVAQKSYGTEKRFLCPPPTAVLIGNEWWSEISKAGTTHGKILPPRVVVSISGEPTPPECTVDWTSGSGKSFDPTDPPPRDATTFVGRAVGKQLFISEVDEKKKKVEALVHVTAPAVDDGPERVIGVFKSRPIKVISKPSKKRQSAKNLELCINHGSTIALFHRLRAQTVSTKYLCVSGSGTAFKGSDGAPLHDTTNHRTNSPSFAAQTTSWDSFIMYIVDVNKPSAADAAPPPSPPISGYPPPPPNAIPFSSNGSQIPVYYNQTVVLQCLTSGVVSPILIMRKVDHSTMVVGGGAQDIAKSVPDSYCAPGEVCGDPVSQLHKIAFEVFDPAKGAPELGHPGVSSSFLACMGEKVNTHHPEEPRAWNSPLHSSPASHSPSLPGSPVISTPTSATSANGEYFNGTVGMSPSDHDFPSSDGGRVRRKRNSTSREGRAPTATKARKARQSSTGSNRGGSGGEGPQTGTQASGALWSIDVGETSIWTIVGTDQVRYNFYIPPAIFEPGAASQPYAHPIPSKQVTPFPDVVKYLPPDRAMELPKCSSTGSASGRQMITSLQQARMLTVYGTNFSKVDPVTVFFGAEPSPHVEVRCTEVLACLPPESNPPSSSKPMLLVRSDGVVFPSNCMYP